MLINSLIEIDVNALLFELKIAFAENKKVLFETNVKIKEMKKANNEKLSLNIVNVEKVMYY